MDSTNRPATLTGLAVGDAMGLPFETHHFGSARLMDWQGGFVACRGINERMPDSEAGQWSDDTMMARALAETLVTHHTYSPVAAAAMYVEWFESGDHRGMGSNTRAALERLVQGYHWVNAGLAHSEGNGSAMRAAPLGLFYRNSFITTADMARQDAIITHRSLEAIEGSAAMALGTAILAAGASNPNELTGAVVELLQESKLRTRLHEDFKWRKESIRSAKDVMQRLIERGTGAHVVESVPAAFLCFASCTSFKDTVEMAIRLGGDTDTVAAMAGALAGTFYGDDEVDPFVIDLEDAAQIKHLNNLLFLAAPRFPEEP